MKRVFVTQRVDTVSGYGERRDALDQCWAHFLPETGAIPFPLPNNAAVISEMLAAMPPDGILLTGGNSPVEYGGDAPERDAADALLIEYATRRGIPLIGVCRGMQSALLHFGGSLKTVEGHIAVRHRLSGTGGRTVNSYHALAADSLPPELEPLLYAGDGVAEAVRHKILPVGAVMWHPEREEVLSREDVRLFRVMWHEGTFLL